MLRRCGGQVRASFGGAYGLDFGAVIAFAAGMGVAGSLFFDLLPDVEGVLVRSYRKEGDE